MSFLNSIISSIGESDGRAPTGKPAPPPNKQTPLSRPAQAGVSSGPSRPAAGTGNIAQRANPAASKAAVTAAPKSQTTTPSISRTSSPAQRSAIAPPPKSKEAYKGTSRPAGVSKPAGAPVKPSNGASTRQPAPAAPAASAAAPKKGYLAILERAKAAQEAAKPFGQIKHQRTAEKERMSRKEKERIAAEAAAAAKQKSKGSLPQQRNGMPAAARTNSPAKKSRPEIEYKGTMRAAPSKPEYKGTMRSGEAPRTGSKHGRNEKATSYRYADTDDDEEDYGSEEDEDENDYDSASSDMEAGRDELDEEEFRSTLLAKKEDEEALEEEEALRREKLARKRKLQALNAAAAKRKKVY